MPKLDYDDEQVLDELAARIMKLPGIVTHHESSVLLEYQGDDEEMFLKFMSDGGMTDDDNGAVLDELFHTSNVPHDFFAERKFLIDADELVTYLDNMKV